MTNEKKLEMWQDLGVHGWVIVMILMACIMHGCDDGVLTDPNNNSNTNVNNGNSSTQVTVASTGMIAVMTSEYSAQDNFLARQNNVYHTLALVRPAIMIVSGQNRLAIDAASPLEIWTVPQGNQQVFIQLLQTYYANSGSWGPPDLFPTDWATARDFQWMLSLFACSPQVNRPELAPSGCPSQGAIPSGLFQLVSSNGHDDWQYSGAVQFRLVRAL